MSPINLKFVRKKRIERKLRQQILEQFATESNSLALKKLTTPYLSVLNRGIDSLPPQRRELFTLCKIEGRNYDEVSNLLKLPASSICDQVKEANGQIYRYLLYHL